MCIRDRTEAARRVSADQAWVVVVGQASEFIDALRAAHPDVCLLYTSDAADERSSVDLGGRRIIKKKKQVAQRGGDREVEHRAHETRTQQTG